MTHRRRVWEPTINRYSSAIAEILSTIPSEWQLVRVNDNKAPYQKEWTTNFSTQEEVVNSYLRDSCSAIGVILGEVSDNLIAVDVDGEQAHERLLSHLSEREREDLLLTVKVTSGLPHRYQAFFRVPDKYSEKLPQRKVFTTRTKGDDLDFRYTNHQSVILGQHPKTSGYFWINSPTNYYIEEFPMSLIKLLLEDFV